jgi:WD repeat-containing protein 19
MIKWARQKTSDNKGTFTTISTVLLNKTILIYDIKKKTNPIELALDSDYGNIVTYQWFGDGYIAIGFTKGYVSIISTHMTEIKNEVNSIQPFRSGLDDLSVCEEVSRLAVAGENCVKFFDTNTWVEIAEEKIEISVQSGRIAKIQWSSTGQILIVSTLMGSIFAFNVVVKDSFAISKNLFTSLCSLNEIVTFEVTSNSVQKLYQIQLIEEPRVFAVSQKYLIASFGTRYQVFKSEEITGADKYTDSSSSVKDFPSIISNLALNNEYLAILSEGRVHLMKLDGEYMVEKIFPLKDTDVEIITIILTEQFLVYSDSNNRVRVYILKENCANINDFKFENQIKKIFPNLNGTKFVCVDNLGKGFLFNPVNDTYIPINNTVEIQTIIWDVSDANIFAVVLSNFTVNTFVFLESNMEGCKLRIIMDYCYIEGILN